MNSSKNLQAIVFDFDGILVDSEPVHYRALAEVLEKNYGKLLSWGDYQKTILGLGDFETFEKLLPGYGHDAVLSCVSKKTAIFKKIAVEKTAFQPGVPELLELLAAKKFPIAIASGALKEDILAVLNRLGGAKLISRFLTIASADEVKHAKPDPEVYTLACQRVGFAPSNCMSFEDTVFGVTASKGAGLCTIAVTHSMSREKLAPFADKVIAGFTGMTWETVQSLYTYFAKD